MDVFTWSVPFVTEKVLEIFACIIRTPRNFVDMGATATSATPEEQKTEEVDLPSLDYKAPEAKQRARYDVLRKRIKFVGKMMRMVRTLREENEQIVMLKGL
jgi:serine/threonine-protein phosphatase 2B catalytic subunit